MKSKRAFVKLTVGVFVVYDFFYYVHGLNHGKLYYVQVKGLRMYVV